MTRIITVAASKGGTAKSTSTIALAAAFALLDQRVLVIDMDPQGDASFFMGFEQHGGNFLMNALLQGHALKWVPTTENFDFVEGGGALDAATTALPDAHFDPHMSLKHCINATTLEHDVVLIDTPTNLGIHVLNALAASTDVLLPVETSVLSLSNLERTKTYVGKIQERVNPALNILGIIPTRVDTQTVLDQDVIDELHNEPFEVFEPVPKSVRVKEAPDYNQSIIAYEPTNKASKAYMSIARRLLEVIHGK